MHHAIYSFLNASHRTESRNYYYYSSPNPQNSSIVLSCSTGPRQSAGEGAQDDAHAGVSMLLEIIEGRHPMLQQCMPRVIQLVLRTACSQAVDLELRGHACQVCCHVKSSAAAVLLPG
jgi:hypothetical protein